MPFPRVLRACSVGMLIGCAAVRMVGQASGYDLPPKNILDVMLAAPPPIPVVSPAKDRRTIASMTLPVGTGLRPARLRLTW